MVRFFLLIVVMLMPYLAFTQSDVSTTSDLDKPIYQANINPSKFELIVAAVLTGPLGGHRILMKSKPRVVFFYALTLGGGFGLLPLIDILHIAFSKDLNELNGRGLFIFNEETEE